MTPLTRPLQQATTLTSRPRPSHQVLRYRTETVADWPQEATLDLGAIQLYPDRSGRCSPNSCGPHDITDAITNGMLHWGWDGDLAVPDTYFEQVCGNHDCCYNTCGTSQQLCDTELLELARSECRMALTCNAHLPDAYYWGVSGLGAHSFAMAQGACGEQPPQV